MKIITLGDIFKNLETEDKAFKFLKYIKELQEENERLLKKSYSDDVRINKAIEYIESNPPVFYDENLIDVETLIENEGTFDYIGKIEFISNLLNILKEE